MKDKVVMEPGAVGESGSDIVMMRTGIEAVSKSMEQRIELIDRIHTLLQSRIEPERDLQRIGGNFRRTINFARVCRRVVGGDVTYRRNPETDMPYRRSDYKDDAGAYYTYTCSCEWKLPWGEVVEGMAIVSSRDPFFGIEDEQLKDSSEVNEAHIAQKSVTEAFKQAVFVGLGFPKDVTENELAKYGVDGGKAGGHDFSAARGKRGGSKDASTDEKDTRAKIEVGCRQLFDGGWTDKHGGKPGKPEDVLQAITANPPDWPGWKSFRAISARSLPRTLKEVDEAIEKFEAAMSGGVAGE